MIENSQYDVFGRKYEDILSASKGIVHPKMKIQSLSSHPHADRSFFSPQNSAGVSQEKGVAKNGDQVSNIKNIHNTIKCLHTARAK